MVTPPGAPYMVGMPQMNIYADDFTTAVIWISSEKETTARLMYATSFDPQFNEPKSVLFNIKRSYFPKEYVFNFKALTRPWQGFVKQFVLLPEGGVAGITVESFKVCSSSPITSLRSGISEFLGPNTRTIVGSTVNNMRVTTFMGHPLNLYLVSCVIIACLIAFIYFLVMGGNVASSLAFAGRITIAASLIMWAISASSQLFSESIQIRTDIQRYGLMSLEEKESISTGPDLFAFIKEIKKEVPDRARVDIRSSGGNKEFIISKAQFYLYPMDFYSSKEVEYVVVFEPDKPISEYLKQFPGSQLKKQYNERAYILWKKKK
jgi:hypothetical protein